MRRKRLKHYADIICKMFVGWRMGDDFELLASLPDGTIEPPQYHITTIYVQDESENVKKTMRLIALLCAFSIAAFAQKKIPSVAVMELESQTVDKSTARSITDAVADEVLKSKNARVMERSQMEKILQEQGFQQSGACDGTECAVEVGKLLSIDQMIVGSIGKIGESNTINLRLVNITSGELINSARIMQRGKIDEIVASAVPEIVQQLFPSGNEENNIKTSLLIDNQTNSDSVSKGKNVINFEPNAINHKTSNVKFATRLAACITVVGCAIGAWKIEDTYQNELSTYKANNNGSSSGISKSENTKIGEASLIAISVMSTAVFGLSFAF